MAKKYCITNLSAQQFVIQQSDIDKAINYHTNKNDNYHSQLVQFLQKEMFYSYVYNTIKFRIRPYDGFRKILKPVVDSLFSDRPQIIIKVITIDKDAEFRIAINNGLE